MELTADWQGRPRWRCPECGTYGSPDHESGGEVCRLLIEERRAKCFD